MEFDMLLRNFAGFGLAIVLGSLTLSGCWNSDGYSETTTPDGVYLEYENPEELEQLKAAEPFFLAMAKRDYKSAYQMMSKWAKQDFALAQFGFLNLTDKDKKIRLPELSEQQFVDYCLRFEAQVATPEQVEEMYIETLDAELLAGGGDAFDKMMAVGMISDNVPTDIRRSSVRGYLVGVHTQETITEIMKQYKIDEKEARSEDWKPGLVLKAVMVEEDREFKVGYFEIFIDND